MATIISGSSPAGCQLQAETKQRGWGLFPSSAHGTHPGLAMSVSLGNHNACPASFSVESTHVGLQGPCLLQPGSGIS